jgi:hypothetical protein
MLIKNAIMRVISISNARLKHAANRAAGFPPYFA